jgi:hypothetical protein
MDYWCCGVWPSIGCGAVARALTCAHAGTSRSANSIEFLVTPRNLSKSRLDSIIHESQLRHLVELKVCGLHAGSCTRVATNRAVMVWLGSARPTTSKRRLANLVFIAHSARRTARPPWSSANTYVSAKKDGWQQLYNSFTCLSLGCITQLSRYLSSAEQVTTTAFRTP